MRENRDGTLYTLVYGRVAALAVDPVEKKPLYHFLPGKPALSYSTVGCNLRCLYCQNDGLSMAAPEARRAEYVTPAEMVDLARTNRAAMIAHTYSEPTVFYEYCLDIAEAGRAAGVPSVLVSNGYIERAPLVRLAGTVAAANVDLKAGSEAMYRTLTSASMAPVLRSIDTLLEAGVWVEVTTLLVPGYNDSEQELLAICGEIARRSPSIPWHVSRFHPAFRLSNLPPTPVQSIRNACALAKSCGLRYVYTGNVWPGQEDSLCHGCGSVLIRRKGFVLTDLRVTNGSCPDCGQTFSGVFDTGSR